MALLFETVRLYGEGKNHILLLCHGAHTTQVLQAANNVSKKCQSKRILTSRTTADHHEACIDGDAWPLLLIDKQ